MDKYFLILLYFSLQHSKILAAKTSLLTWLAIPRLFLFFLLVLIFLSLQTDKSTSCVARMFVLKCGHLKHFLMCDFLKYISLCCLAGPVPKYSSNECSRKTKDRLGASFPLKSSGNYIFPCSPSLTTNAARPSAESVGCVLGSKPTTYYPSSYYCTMNQFMGIWFCPTFFFSIMRSSHTAEDLLKCTQITLCFALIPLLPFLTGNIRHSVIQVTECLRTLQVFSSSAVVLPGEVTASGPHPAFSGLSPGRSCHQICQKNSVSLHVPPTDVFVPTAELTSEFVRVWGSKALLCLLKAFSSCKFRELTWHVQRQQ